MTVLTQGNIFVLFYAAVDRLNFIQQITVISCYTALI